MWQPLAAHLARLPSVNIANIMVSFSGLVPEGARQLDLWVGEDPDRKRWEQITATIDQVHLAANRSLITVGPWSPPPGGNAGGKIAFTRVPEAEDFWEDAQ
jgi:DNA polymerase-4